MPAATRVAGLYLLEPAWPQGDERPPHPAPMIGSRKKKDAEASKDKSEQNPARTDRISRRVRLRRVADRRGGTPDLQQRVKGDVGESLIRLTPGPIPIHH